MYTLSQAGAIVRDADSATIPSDDRNADYREYLAWRAAGNVPADPPQPPPNDVIKAQIAALETGTPITPRAHREFMLAVATLLNVPLTSPGLAAAKTLNDKISALRAQIS